MLGLFVIGAAISGCSKGTTLPPVEIQSVEAPVVNQNKMTRTNEEWKKILTPEQYHILREKGTERAFSGQYHDYHGTGVFVCAACGQALFRSQEKFDSGTGWPSFWAPASFGAVETEMDKSFFATRTEVHCSLCGGHLGHVFDDGPKPTGKRYCINSAALKLVESK